MCLGLNCHLFYVLGDGRQPNSRGLKNPPSSTLLHGKINPKDWQVLSLGDAGFLQFFKGLFQVIMANPDCKCKDSLLRMG